MNDEDFDSQPSSEPPVFLPEGSTVHVWKPELSVKFLSLKRKVGDNHAATYSSPGKTIMKRIKCSDNVLSIKGLAVDRIKELVSPYASVNFDQIFVFVSNEGKLDTVKRLDDNQMLVDLVIERKELVV